MGGRWRGCRANLPGAAESARDKPSGVVLLLIPAESACTGECRLIAIRDPAAVVRARAAGVPVIVVSAASMGDWRPGHRYAGCDWVVMSGRAASPSPARGDRGAARRGGIRRARPRVVCRTMGGQASLPAGEADALAADTFVSLRAAVAPLLNHPRPLDLESLQREHGAWRGLQRFGDAADAADIWKRLGVADVRACR